MNSYNYHLIDQFHPLCQAKNNFVRKFIFNLIVFYDSSIEFRIFYQLTSNIQIFVRKQNFECRNGDLPEEIIYSFVFRIFYV